MLEDDEEAETLTHYGQSLAEIDRHDRPTEKEDLDDDKIGQEFVTGAHFGGGDGEGDQKKRRKQMIEVSIVFSSNNVRLTSPKAA